MTRITVNSTICGFTHKNYVINRAQEAQCSSNCLVPCAVFNLCKLESGFMDKSLAKKAGSISIEFNSV